MNFQVYDKQPEDFIPDVEIAGIYVNVQEKILFLQLGTFKQEKGLWGVPAGKLEVNELPLEAARRELREETGIDIASETPFTSHGKLYVCKPDIRYIFHLFGVRLEDVPPVSLSDEHCEYRWVSKEEAEALPLIGGAKIALNTYFSSI